MGKFNANVYGSAVEETIENAHKNFTKKSDFDVKNYLDTKLGDDESERNITIRILPVSSEDGNFRIAVKTHNLKVSKRIAASGFKSFLCLNDPQVPDYDPHVHCPLCEKSQFYFNEAKKYRETEPEKSKALFMKACSLKSKTTYIVRVIERGKENEGVKFWRFNENTQGKGIYDSLIALYKQRKDDMAEAGIANYNIFDLDEGRDIVLNLKKTVRADGQQGVAIQITDKSINKPLTNDVELGNAWINDVKRWYNAYTVKSHDYLAIVADDKIPYMDKTTGTLIAKTEQDFRDYEEYRHTRDKEAEAASEVLKENVQPQMPTIEKSNDNNDDELPF
jgi:hypothetical protein